MTKQEFIILSRDHVCKKMGQRFLRAQSLVQQDDTYLLSNKEPTEEQGKPFSRRALLDPF